MSYRVNRLNRRTGEGSPNISTNTAANEGMHHLIKLYVGNQISNILNMVRQILAFLVLAAGRFLANIKQVRIYPKLKQFGFGQLTKNQKELVENEIKFMTALKPLSFDTDSNIYEFTDGVRVSLVSLQRITSNCGCDCYVHHNLGCK